MMNRREFMAVSTAVGASALVSCKTPGEREESIEEESSTELKVGDKVIYVGSDWFVPIGSGGYVNRCFDSFKLIGVTFYDSLIRFPRIKNLVKVLDGPLKVGNRVICKDTGICIWLGLLDRKWKLGTVTGIDCTRVVFDCDLPGMTWVFVNPNSFVKIQELS